MKRTICLSLTAILISVIVCVASVALAADYDNIEPSLYIWRLVNEVRHDPAKSLSELGIDIDAVKAHLGKESFILYKKLPPLAFNLNLFDSAQMHNKDMINRGYLDYTSSDHAPSVAFRILFSGYDAVQVGESIGALAFDTYRETFDGAKVIFVNMIKDELFADYPRDYRIFSSIFTEIGVSFQPGYLNINGSGSKRAYVVTMDFGMPKQERSYIIGNVIKSSASSELFDIKSALGGVKVIFKDVFRDLQQTVVSTSGIGAFQFLKPSSEYMVLRAVNSDGSCIGINSFWGAYGNELHDLVVGN